MTRDRAPGVPWFVWRLIRHRPGLWGMHLLLVTSLAYVLPFLPGLLVRQLLDRLTGATAAGWTVPTLIGLFAGVGVAQLLGTVADRLVHTAQTQHAGALLRANMLAHALERPAALALPVAPGDALVRMQSDPESLTFALDFSVDPVGQLFGYAFALTVLARVDWFLTVVVVLPVLAVLLAVNLAGPRVRSARRARQEAMGDVRTLMGEVLAGVRSVQAAGAEERVARRLEALNEARRRAALRDVLVDRLLRSVSANTANLATGVLLMLVAGPARSGGFTAGDFALFTSYLGWFGTVVSLAGQIFTAARQSEASVARMAEMLPGRPAAALVAPRPVPLSGPLPPPAPVMKHVDERLERLEVRNLTFAHPGSGGGVFGVDLDVARGEIVAVTGEIGAGKTTLLRVVLGLLPRDAGEIRWNGRVVEDPGAFLIPPRCAYTPQAPSLFSASLRDNVLLGWAGDGAALAAAARAAVLERDLPALGEGWNTRVGPRGQRLSGGQVQRTALARMFVRNAELLVLDDVSSALDPETEALLWERLLERGDAACLVVTHSPLVLRRADRILVMRHGRAEVVPGHPAEAADHGQTGRPGPRSVS